MKVTSLFNREKQLIREDALLGGNVRLLQPEVGFRAAIDTVLLAAAVPAMSGQKILEPGTGSGAAALCLAYRVVSIQITGIDVNSNSIELAKKNINLNQLAGRVSVAVGDVAGGLGREFNAQFDHVMINPPYLSENSARVSPDPERALATVEGATDLKCWLKYGHDALRHKGYLTLIYRADRLDELIRSVPSNFGGITILPLWPRQGEEAKRVIVQVRKGVRTPARILPGLPIHEADGSYTKTASEILTGAALSL